MIYFRLRTLSLLNVFTGIALIGLLYTMKKEADENTETIGSLLCDVNRLDFLIRNLEWQIKELKKDKTA